MLQRKTKAGLLAITQPAHSWLSGQLARAWGNDLFGAVEPFEEVTLAAGLHDVGFLAWEQTPTQNPKTGRPYTFLELPAAERLAVWTRGIEQLLYLNRYAALLTSLHYTGLTERNPAKPSTAEAKLQAQFLAEQTKFQNTLLNSLRKDSHYAHYTTPEILKRNRKLIATWDWMSLLAGMALAKSIKIEDVPANQRSVTIQLQWLRNPARIRVTPWPFQPPTLELHIEARPLAPRFKNREALLRHLAIAPVKTLPIVLTPE
jgi:hypothetical protein